MIRVIYAWTVAPDRMDEFEQVWRRTTRAIHETTPGARGSFCLRSLDAPDEILTIALWDTEDHWRSFIETAKTGSMKGLHEIGTQTSVRAYHQVGDETVAPA